MLHRLGRRAYFRLVRINYRNRVYARRNRTPCGTVRTYELLNRHGHDRMLESVVADCGPDTVVYDVGANVGMYAITIGTVEPQSRILAFEPAPTTVEQLRANIGCNELNSSVEVHHCGLGASTERQQFHFSTYPELSGFDRASATRWGGTIGETVSVSVRRMDDVVKSAPSPDVVKIDVEGGGPAVIEGAQRVLQQDRPLLFIEPHTEGFRDDPAARMRTRLETLDYRIDDRGGYWRCTPT